MIGAVPRQSTYTPTVRRYGLVVTPVAGGIIADTGQLAEGLYRLDIETSYGGTADVIDNMGLNVNGINVDVLTVLPVVNATPTVNHVPVVYVVLNGKIQVRAIAAGGAGSVYRAVVCATPLATLSLV